MQPKEEAEGIQIDVDKLIRDKENARDVAEKCHHLVMAMKEIGRLTSFEQEAVALRGRVKALEEENSALAKELTKHQKPAKKRKEV